jgi:serine/threonine protein phosphatase PrpC
MSTTPDPQMADTAEIPIFDKPVSASAGVGRVRVDFGAHTHKGNVRPNNEDHFLVARFGRFLQPLITNVHDQKDTVLEEEGHGMVVADGMGGAAAGELASKIAIREMLRLIVQTPDWIISTQCEDAERVMERMSDRYRRIDAALLEEASHNSKLKGMGTTMTLACNVGSCLVLAHIGDSRAYLFRGDKLHQLTHDHTVAQALVDQGYLEKTTDAAMSLQHSLVRVLGGMGHQCKADVQQVELQDQDVIVLCSDGLSDMVDDASIRAVLARRLPAHETSSVLVERALANGGKDNVTVIVARYAFVDRPAANEPQT